MTNAETVLKKVLKTMSQVVADLTAADIEIDAQNAPSSGDHSKEAPAPALATKTGAPGIPTSKIPEDVPPAANVDPSLGKSIGAVSEKEAKGETNNDANVGNVAQDGAEDATSKATSKAKAKADAEADAKIKSGKSSS